MQGPFIKSPVLKVVLGILSALVAIFLVMLVLLTEEARMEAQTASWDGRKIENGAVIFANNCASCHGPNGMGSPGRAPALNSHYFFTQRLADVGWNGSLADYVELTIAAGRPSKTDTQWREVNNPVIMPTWGAAYGGPLRADQVAAVAAYVLNWEESALQQTVEEDPWLPFEDVSKPVEQQNIAAVGTETETPAEEVAAEPRDPETLFTAMTCVACHNLDADQTASNRGPIGPNLGNLAENAASRVEGLSAEEYVHQSIVEPNAHVVDTYVGGVMPQIFAEQMSEEEIDNLVAWLLARSAE